jgi:ABC-2 type transport system permease protein
MLFLTGSTIPMPVLPEIFQKISTWIPITHMVQLLQGLWLVEYDELILHVVVTVGCTLLFLAVSVVTFRWAND